MGHILIIEPNKQIAKLLKITLEEADFSVSLASNGHTAVSMADANKPDLVVLDIQLPGHSGFEFLYEFRTYDDWLDIPVIIFSSVEIDKKLVEGPTWRALGVTDYYSKQNTPLDKIIKAVQQNLVASPKAR